LDERILWKWKEEALSAYGMDMSELMFDYCIDELRYKFKRLKGCITVYDGDVVKSDTAIPSSLQVALRDAVAPLENIPVVYRDWHPGSNEIVLDLVHPSLFPVIYGRTRILRDNVVGLGDCVKKCGEGETLSIQNNTHDIDLEDLSRHSYLYSRKISMAAVRSKVSRRQIHVCLFSNY
jgi:hypothetical protein